MKARADPPRNAPVASHKDTIPPKVSKSSSFQRHDPKYVELLQAKEKLFSELSRQTLLKPPPKTSYRTYVGYFPNPSTIKLFSEDGEVSLPKDASPSDLPFRSYIDHIVVNKKFEPRIFCSCKNEEDFSTLFNFLNLHCNFAFGQHDKEHPCAIITSLLLLLWVPSFSGSVRD